MESYGNPTVMHWDHGESFFQTSRLQSWDFVPTNSSAPGPLEKVVLGDGYTPSNLLSPEWWPISPTELWGRTRKPQSSGPLWNAQLQRSWLPSSIHTPVKKKQRRGRTVHHMHRPKFQRSPCVGDGRIGNPHGATLRKPHGMHLRITTGGFAEVAPSWGYSNGGE